MQTLKLLFSHPVIKRSRLHLLHCVPVLLAGLNTQGHVLGLALDVLASLLRVAKPLLFFPGFLCGLQSLRGNFRFSRCLGRLLFPGQFRRVPGGQLPGLLSVQITQGRGSFLTPTHVPGKLVKVLDFVRVYVELEIPFVARCTNVSCSIIPGGAMKGINVCLCFPLPLVDRPCVSKGEALILLMIKRNRRAIIKPNLNMILTLFLNSSKISIDQIFVYTLRCGVKLNPIADSYRLLKLLFPLLTIIGYAATHLPHLAHDLAACVVYPVHFRIHSSINEPVHVWIPRDVPFPILQ